MSRYSQMLMEFSRQNRPNAFAQVSDPEAFFRSAAAQIRTEVAALRSEILGPQGADESDESYRSRSSQALASAEELILSDHWLLQPEQVAEDDLTKDDDRTVASYYQDLEAISTVTNDTDW